MAKTTKEHFAIFTYGVNKWQKELGLTDWCITLRHLKRNDALATTNCNGNGRLATIVFSTDWPSDIITDERVRLVALHEVLHVLLFDMTWIGECRFISDSEMPVAEHSVVRRLEKVLARLDG